MKYINRVLFLTLVGLSAFLPLEAAVYQPKIHKLANRLELIVIENHRAPLVIHMMVFKVGTNHSPWGILSLCLPRIVPLK